MRSAEQTLRVLQIVRPSPGAILLASDVVLPATDRTDRNTRDRRRRRRRCHARRPPALLRRLRPTPPSLARPARMQAEQRELAPGHARRLHHATATPPARAGDREAYLRNAMRAESPPGPAKATSPCAEITHDRRPPRAARRRQPTGPPWTAELRSSPDPAQGPQGRVRQPDQPASATGGREHRIPLPALAEKVREAELSPNRASAPPWPRWPRSTPCASASCATCSSPTSSTDACASAGATFCSPRLCEPAWPPGSTTATEPGPTAPTRTCSSTGAPHPDSSRQGPTTHGLSALPQALREDRILHEIHATGGDVRRLCDLFGVSGGSWCPYSRGFLWPVIAACGRCSWSSGACDTPANHLIDCRDS